MTANIIYLGELRTESEHVRSGQKVISDAPVDNRGKGEAFSPTDMVATSLGTCMITTMGIRAMDNGIGVKDIRADVTKVMATDPRRIAEIRIDLSISIENDNPAARKILEDAAINCPVAKSVHPEIKQEVRFSYEH